MSIATYAAYKTRRDEPTQILRIAKDLNGSPLQSNRYYSSWRLNGGAPVQGGTPSTAAACTSADTGAIQFVNPVGTGRVLRASMFLTDTNNENNSGHFILADRLTHQGGLSGTAAGAQTTNLPTAALTRYTTGDDVLLLLETYSTSSGTNVTVSYTNQAGTAGRTSVGGEAVPTEATQTRMLPLQQGDTGIRAVASVTIGTPGATAGNFGVTLAYPIVAVQVKAWERACDLEAIFGLGSWFPQVNSNACLYVLLHGTRGNTQWMHGEFYVGED